MQIIKAFFLNIKSILPALCIYLSVCITLLVLLSKNGPAQKSMKFESTRLDIVIQDKNQSELSKGLIHFLSQNHHIIQKNYSLDNLADKLFYGEIDYSLTIPKNFETSLLKGSGTHCLQSRKDNDSANGYFVDVQIDQYLSLLSGFLVAGYPATDAIAATEKAMAQEVPVTVAAKENASKSSYISALFTYIPYSLICMILIGLGMILITFRQEEIHTRICCSALSIMRRNMQLLAGSILFSLGCWILQIIIGVLLLSINLFSKQGLLYVANSLIFLMVIMSITFLVSFFAHSDNMLNLVGNIVALGLCFLGGIYVPLDYMSDSVVRISHLLPSYWYITGMEKIEQYTTHTAPFSDVLSHMGIQILFAIAILCVALVISKLKKQ